MTQDVQVVLVGIITRAGGTMYEFIARVNGEIVMEEIEEPEPRVFRILIKDGVDSAQALHRFEQKIIADVTVGEVRIF